MREHGGRAGGGETEQREGRRSNPLSASSEGGNPKSRARAQTQRDGEEQGGGEGHQPGRDPPRGAREGSPREERSPAPARAAPAPSHLLLPRRDLDESGRGESRRDRGGGVGREGGMGRREWRGEGGGEAGGGDPEMRMRRGVAGRGKKAEEEMERDGDGEERRRKERGPEIGRAHV